MGKWVYEDRVGTYEKVSGIGKFKSEYFESTEDSFYNLLSQKTVKTMADLRHIICNRVVLSLFPVVAVYVPYLNFQRGV